MYDLILCHIPEMGLIAPRTRARSPSPGLSGLSIAEIFEEKIPNYGDNDGEERHVVGPELIAYLHCPPVIDLQCFEQVTGPGHAETNTRSTTTLG